MRPLLTVWAMILLLAPMHAMDKAQADTLAARAVAHYAAGDIAAARTLFDSVAVEWNSAALQYNLGNCHYKLGDVGRAILHYERALRLAPGAADVQANLELARQQIVDRVHELPGLSLGATWSRLRGGRDADQWARRSILAAFAFFAVLAAALTVRRRGTALLLKGVAVLLGIVLIGSIAFAMARHNELHDRSAAIVLAPKVDVRSAPGEDATRLFVLHTGTKLTVLQEREGWCEVRLANGNVGWMPAGAVERI
jgi:tetratricopeptide (TPR) repeat protein